MKTDKKKAKDEKDWFGRIVLILEMLWDLLILRFRLGERESEFIDNCAVDDDTVSFWGAHRVLGDERSVYLFCADVEACIKG